MNHATNRSLLVLLFLALSVGCSLKRARSPRALPRLSRTRRDHAEPTNQRMNLGGILQW